MPTAGIKVLFTDKVWDVPYDTCKLKNSNSLMETIARFNPDVIVSSQYSPGQLVTSGFDLRMRWINIKKESKKEEVIKSIEDCYYANTFLVHDKKDENPLVSVYTGTYNTGDYLQDTYQALRDQTYANWEWVVIDDASTDGTWEKLLAFSDIDYRVRPVRIKHSGKIGNVKDIASRLCNGEFIVELDHDDILVDIALDEVQKAFLSDPEIGMVYTNCAMFYSNGKPQKFNDEFWSSRYRDQIYKGKHYAECVCPNIYDRINNSNHFTQQCGWYLTVGPNHIRAYRTKTLRELGGYNRHLPVADDWDVFARFFLYSKCHHIDKMLYLQRIVDNYRNTTYVRNKSIQDNLELCRKYYSSAFSEFNKKRIEAGDSLHSKQKEEITEKELENEFGLSVVVLDWNTKGKTEKCLEKVREAEPECEIILVQNGEHFECEHADKIVKLEENIGFSAGCNRGAMEASKSTICFLNSDAYVEDDTLGLLMSALKLGNVGVVAPYTNRGKPPQGNYGKAPTKSIEVDMVTGMCMMMTKETFRKTGGFDCSFCNFEDDDICKKIKGFGLSCVVVGGAFVDHDENASFIANNVDVESKIRSSEIKFHKKWPKIGLALITYNEMDALPGFYEQYKHIVSEKVIVDSGSTDGTVEWAKENGFIVIHKDFENFADQRNHAIDQIIDSEWIIMHDPDERLDQGTINNLPELVRGENAYDIYLSPLQSEDHEGKRQNWIAKPFLFRKSLDIEWVFPVHEKLIGSNKQALIKNSMITHVLDLHSSERRTEMIGKYDNLGSDSLESEYNGFPILNYKYPDNKKIKKITLGPLVSVIVPTYNREDLLILAIKSILRQDYFPIEIVIVGDNCPKLDKMSEFLKSICDRKIVIKNLKNNHGEGGAVPRNYALMLSSGRLVAYLDDDNIFKTNHISSLVSCMAKNMSDFVLSSMMIDDYAHICDIPEKGKADTSCLLHRKHLISDCGWWKNRDEDGYAHDWQFIKRFIDAKKRCSTTMSPTVIYNKETSGQIEYLDKLILKNKK